MLAPSEWLSSIIQLSRHSCTDSSVFGVLGSTLLSIGFSGRTFVCSKEILRKDLLRVSANDSRGSSVDTSFRPIVSSVTRTKSSSESISSLVFPPALRRPILTSSAKDLGLHGLELLFGAWRSGAADRHTLPALRRPSFTLVERDSTSSAISKSSTFSARRISSDTGSGILLSSVSLACIFPALRSPSLTSLARSTEESSPPLTSQGLALVLSFSACFLSDSAFLVESQVEQSEERMVGHTTRIFPVSGAAFLDTEGFARNLSSSASEIFISSS